MEYPTSTGNVSTDHDGNRIISLTLILIAFGLVMIFSSSDILSSSKFQFSYTLVWKQLSRGIIGVVLMIYISKKDYHFFQNRSKLLLNLSIVLLVILLLPFTYSIAPIYKNVRRWISLGPLTFQPSEFTKLALMCWIAAVIARKKGKLATFKDGVFPFVFVIGLVSFLIMKQPDLGTAAMVAVLAGTMLFIGGVQIRYITWISGGMLIFMLLAVFSLESYPFLRLLSFLKGGSDYYGLNWQVSQSLIGLGSGGFFGVGLGSSFQKYFFLPEPYGDFIYSIVGEELGFLGTSFTLFAFFYFAYLGYKIAFSAVDRFGFLLASGITTMIIFSALINMGVVTNLLPTAGLPLPFISFGGSSLIISLVGVGILKSISRQSSAKRAFPIEH